MAYATSSLCCFQKLSFELEPQKGDSGQVWLRVGSDTRLVRLKFQLRLKLKIVEQRMVLKLFCICVGFWQASSTGSVHFKIPVCAGTLYWYT